MKSTHVVQGEVNLMYGNLRVVHFASSYLGIVEVCYLSSCVMVVSWMTIGNGLVDIQNPTCT